MIRTTKLRKLTKVSKWTPLSRRQLRIDLYDGFEIKLDVIDNFGLILDDRLVTLSDRKSLKVCENRFLLV